ncbi:MAG: hypothetical protein FWE86_05405, partial [Oscillospiraceae bacterium]|nr:hypothetical protein [Oscillospiraceae bacterium]
MISSTLQNWQKSRNYRRDGENVYGVCDGIGFSMSEEDGGKLAVFMLKGTDGAFTALENVFAADSSELRQVQVGDVEGYLALFYDESRGQMPEYLLDELLSFSARTCRRCGFSVPNRCVSCGEKATKRTFHEGMVQPMCAICSDKKKSGASYAPMAAPPPPLRTEEAFAGRVPGYGDSDYMSPMQRPRDDINYDSREYDYNYSSEGSAKGGALGAIVGTVAGLVVYVATMLLNLPVAALATLAGIGGVLGYIAFGGPRKKSSAVKTVLGVSAGVSVLFVLINHVFSGVARAG